MPVAFIGANTDFVIERTQWNKLAPELVVNNANNL